MPELVQNPISKRWSARFINEAGQKRRINLQTTEYSKAVEKMARFKIAELETLAEEERLRRKVESKLFDLHTTTVEHARIRWREFNKTRIRAITIDLQQRTICTWTKKMGLKDTPVSQITEQHLYDYFNAPDNKTTHLTRSKRLGILKVFFEFCRDQRWVAKNPAKHVIIDISKMSQQQLQVKRGIPFTKEEAETILGLTGPNGKFKDMELYALLYFALHTGLRAHDLFNLEWFSLRTEGQMEVVTSKTGRRVILPTTAGLDAMIEEIKRYRVSDPLKDMYVFPVWRRRWNVVMGGDLERSIQSPFRLVFKRLMRHAGVTDPRKNFHSFRHTYATEQQRAGTELAKIASDLGHTKLSTTEGYMHMHREITAAIADLKAKPKPVVEGGTVVLTQELAALFKVLWG